MTLFFVALAVAAVALAASSKRSTPPSSEFQVRGKSGLVWGVKLIFNDDGNKLVEVINRDGRTGHDPNPVIRYVQQGSDTNARFLASIGEKTTAGLVRSAMADFGVKGPVPSGNVLPPNPSPMVPAGKIQILRGGYQANVVIPFPASIIATAGLLQRGITEKGFTNVRVLTERPKSWFTDEDADYYVFATWPDDEPALFDKPKALSAFKKTS